MNELISALINNGANCEYIHRNIESSACKWCGHMTDWCSFCPPITGWGVPETWRCQWFHLPREARGHCGRTRTLCHVSWIPILLLYKILQCHSSLVLQYLKVWLACGTRLWTIEYVSSPFTDISMLCACVSISVFPCSHKLADAKTRKVMGRDEFRLLHYAGEVNYNVNGVCVGNYLWGRTPWDVPFWFKGGSSTTIIQ